MTDRYVFHLRNAERYEAISRAPWLSEEHREALLKRAERERKIAAGLRA